MAEPRPKRDRPPRRSKLKRHEMVTWLAPSTLMRALAETGVSWVFGTFADKREIQGSLPAEVISHDEDIDDDGSIWIDFASDVGDGFNSTYTVAWLLAQPELTLARDGREHATRRGRLLVLGGDQVYPAARWDRYREKFANPYRAALPFVEEPKAPWMFAIPGNHDWYDGLTSFMRLFCQQRWIGGWRTQQRRSYFAIRLPQRWWLWGIDIQLDTYLDEPQLDYFEQVAREELEEGDRVILVTSKPSWVRADERPSAQSWSTLTFFEETVVKGHGGVLALTLTGDIHHYCHYGGPDAAQPAHRITSGTGGAFLSATHTMKRTLSLKPHRSGQVVKYDRLATFPEIDESRSMSRGVLRLLNPLFTWTLGLLTGGIYAFFAVLLAAGLKDQGTSVLSNFDGRGPIALLGDALTPWFFLSAALLAWLLRARADVDAPGPRQRAVKRLRYGALHTLAHLVPMVAATLLVLWGLNELSLADKGFWPGYLAAALLFLFGWQWGRSVLAFYFYGAHRRNPKQHATDVFAAQRIEDYKGFIRLRLDSAGNLTVFPIGVRRVVRDWELKEETDDEQELLEPWFEPASGQPPEPELIEQPFTV